MVDKPLCIIPARGGSKRFPRKNIALLRGKPLLIYSIEVALECELFETICVSSEDEEILNLAQAHGALALPRPAELSADNVGCDQVCLHVLEHFARQGCQYAYFALLLPTHPLRAAADLRAAYDLLRQAEANYVMSLVPYGNPPQRAVWAPQGYVEPYFGPQYMKPAQLLDTLYWHDGAILWARSEAFLREKTIYGTKIVPYFLSVERSADIDDPLDLAWAEFLLARSGAEGQPKVRMA